MSKIISRILLTLLAASLVSGVLYLVVTQTSMPVVQAGISEARNSSAEIPSADSGTAETTQNDLQVRRQLHEGKSAEFNSMSLQLLLKNAATIAVVTVIVVLLQKLFSSIFRKKTQENHMPAAE